MRDVVILQPHILRILQQVQAVLLLYFAVGESSVVAQLLLLYLIQHCHYCLIVDRLRLEQLGLIHGILLRLQKHYRPMIYTLAAVCAGQLIFDHNLDRHEHEIGDFLIAVVIIGVCLVHDAFELILLIQIFELAA